MKIPSSISCVIVAGLCLTSACSSFVASPAVQISGRSGSAVAKLAGRKDLYVANYEIGTIFLFKNDGFTPDGSIKSGISGPWGVTLDRLGNLYVANTGAADVAEYAPGGSTPSFTYSKGMTTPRLVSVDSNGNVFITDFTDYSHDGRISEFAQGTDDPVYSCSLVAPWGVATDAAGDVFVAYNVSQGGGGRIAEFKGGLAGCSLTELGVHVEKATGLALDRRGNILIGDYSAGHIDVVPPPYATIARHLDTGGRGPMSISIDSSNKRVFASVSGFYHNNVLVVNYASGEVERRLGGGRRLEGAFGVVDGPNSVP
jgi:DNA-binding beta-propeller fold protein YncE